MKALADELEPFQITSAQWSALRILWAEEGLSQVELAQRMLVEKASLTPVLEAMSASGLIKRTRSPVDRRKMSIILTDAGRRLQAQLLPLGDRINKRAARGMSDREIEQLHNLIEKAVRNLQA